MAGRPSSGDLSHLFDNLNDPEPLVNKRETILGVSITFLIISCSCVLTRLYTRLWVVRSPGWDDLLIVVYLLFTVVGTGAICLATNYGMGKHFALLHPETARAYIIVFYVGSAAYITCTALIKLSLLFQYLRVYNRGTTMYRLCIGLLVFTALWGTAYTFMAWFPCFPIKDLWLAPPGARCYAFGSPNPHIFAATYESHTGVNMVLDVLVLAAPVPMYFDKHTPQKTRRGLLALLFMGCLVNVFSVWRLATIVEHKAATYPVRDPTWYGPISILLAILEVDAASICASVPVFWPRISSHFGRIFVTQEIDITHEDRYELTTTPSQGLGPVDGTHSRTGSDTELSTGIAGAKSKEMHYKDGFVISLVDPLRQATSGNVESRVRSEGTRNNRKWFRV